ncbi:MAG: DUF962 domain-containing protein [Proteobacteria bacterium]|nr:DUF962 domain-containing protein [Pseudomonadota bacterium]
MDSTNRVYSNFKEFWPFYLSQHSNRICRILHVFGTTLAVAFVAGCLITACFSWLPLALVLGYGPAWIGHFGFEKNRPATFKYPLWSFRADFKMLGLFYTGKLEAEFFAFKIEPRG